MVKTEYYKDLTKMNTFGMKVKARCFIEYDSVADLVDIEFEELARPVLHIGGGSNLLFTDDFKGTILHSKIDFIEVLDECHGSSVERCTSAVPLVSPKCSENIAEDNASAEIVYVSVGAGVVFDDFCDWAAKEGLWGAENLSYIPGEVGASAIQNIGAYGVEVKDIIHKVYCYDTLEEEFVNFSLEECGYGYRDSIFKKPEVKGRYIVTHVVFALSREPKPQLGYGQLHESVMAAVGTSDITPAAIRKVIIKIRKEKLPEPSVMGSAGSFFMNPVVAREKADELKALYPSMPLYPAAEGVKLSAGWLIDQCGWKERSDERVGVYRHQALVIVNLGGATGAEVMDFAHKIQESVAAKFGVRISPEVNSIE